MIKFTIMCDFNGKQSPVIFYLGYPLPENHPIKFQMNWLGSEKGGQVPGNIVESLEKLQKMALDNNVDFVELAQHALMDAVAS